MGRYRANTFGATIGFAHFYFYLSVSILVLSHRRGPARTPISRKRIFPRSTPEQTAFKPFRRAYLRPSSGCTSTTSRRTCLFFFATGMDRGVQLCLGARPAAHLFGRSRCATANDGGQRAPARNLKYHVQTPGAALQTPPGDPSSQLTFLTKPCRRCDRETTTTANYGGRAPVGTPRAFFDEGDSLTPNLRQPCGRGRRMGGGIHPHHQLASGDWLKRETEPGNPPGQVARSIIIDELTTSLVRRNGAAGVREINIAPNARRRVLGCDGDRLPSRGKIQEEAMHYGDASSHTGRTRSIAVGNTFRNPHWRPGAGSQHRSWRARDRRRKQSRLKRLQGVAMRATPRGGSPARSSSGCSSRDREPQRVFEVLELERGAAARSGRSQRAVPRSAGS